MPAVLLLPELGVIEPNDPRFVSTVAAMERELVREKHVMRYADADDFGLPVTAFLICRFWLIDASGRSAGASRQPSSSTTP
jgi:GH15 family glucan-1,4-alpha-glucosidase